MERLRIAGVLIGLHYLVALAHGLPHQWIPVPLTGFQMAFVVVVISLGPLLGLWLLARGRLRPGWAVLALVLGASFAFGVGFHYVIESPDHVSSIPAGPMQAPFEWTAALSALVDGAGSVLAFVFAVQSTEE